MSKERRKERVGRVIGTKMAKTVVVAVEWQQRHPIYNKAQKRSTKFYAHDGESECAIGDLVRIEETRPISRLKRWRVTNIIERREVAEIKPAELDSEILSTGAREQDAGKAGADEEKQEAQA
jgi:small subunit ribosomal protein S17